MIHDPGRVTVAAAFGNSRRTLAADRAFLLATLPHVIGIVMINATTYLHLRPGVGSAATVAGVVLYYLGSAILARFLLERASGCAAGWRDSIVLDAATRRFFYTALLLGVVMMGLTVAGLAWSEAGGVAGVILSIIVGWLALFAPYYAAHGAPIHTALRRSIVTTSKEPRFIALAAIVLLLQSVSAAVPLLAFLLVPWGMGAIVYYLLHDPSVR